MYTNVLPAHMSMWRAQACLVLKEDRKGCQIDPQVLELQIVMNHPVGARNCTQVLCRSSKH